MLAGHFGGGGARAAGGDSNAAIDWGGGGRPHFQKTNPSRKAATISPEIHFRESRIECQRFAT
jgi:hypothetical protein